MLILECGKENLSKSMLGLVRHLIPTTTIHKNMLSWKITEHRDEDGFAHLKTWVHEKQQTSKDHSTPIELKLLPTTCYKPDYFLGKFLRPRTKFDVPSYHFFSANRPFPSALERSPAISFQSFHISGFHTVRLIKWKCIFVIGNSRIIFPDSGNSTWNFFGYPA